MAEQLISPGSDWQEKAASLEGSDKQSLEEAVSTSILPEQALPAESEISPQQELAKTGSENVLSYFNHYAADIDQGRSATRPGTTLTQFYDVASRLQTQVTQTGKGEFMIAPYGEQGEIYIYNEAAQSLTKQRRPADNGPKFQPRLRH